MSSTMLPVVLVTGGAGYVGSALIPRLLECGYRVRVLDLYLYGEDVFEAQRGPQLEEFRGDIRDRDLVARAMDEVDAVIHLACISNDPSYDLDPELGRSINYDAFFPLVEEARFAEVKRFIYASSSSVYGVRTEPSVTEDVPLEPLTDYSKYKAACEKVLLEHCGPHMTSVIIRPSTVCGYAKRLRLDLVVNILTSHAVLRRKLRVFGGEQLRPNIHIRDMVELYVHLLSQPEDVIDKEVFNAGYENQTVYQLAKMVQQEVGETIPIEVVPTDDKRSYHVSSDKMRRTLGFVPKFTIRDAIADLSNAFERGLVPNALEDSRYYNIRRMQEANLR